MREWVEYAVENYKGKNSFGFQLTKDLKERQIDRAIERYARGVQPKEVAAILDTSAFKSGKTGFLLTDRYLYSDKCKDEGPIGLMYLKDVTVKPENNSCCVVTFEDGSTREIDVSVFLDVVDVLKLIIEQKEKYEAEEKEREKLTEDTGSLGITAEEEASQDTRETIEDGGLDGAGISRELALVRNTAAQGGSLNTVNEGKSSNSADMEESEKGGNLGKENEVETANASEQPCESGTSEMAIEIVQIEDLDEPEESEEERKMRWLADLIQSEELDWGDDTGTPQASQLEKDWIDEIDERGLEAFSERSLMEQEKTAEEEAAEKEAVFEEMLKKAEAGDSEAMFRVAELYYEGLFTQKDQKQALRWFREAAKLEYVPAMLKMMRFYEKGELVKQNLKLSMSWAKKAAATGEAEGKYALAEAYIYGSAGKQDVEEGLKLLEEMAAEGDEIASQKAEDIRQKVKRAKERFDAGIRQPSTASGNYEMGLYCQTGDGFYTYPKEAVQYFLKAAEKEHVHAQYQLALAYHTGEGTRKNEEECVKWLEKAAAKSHKEATELLKEIQEKQRLKREKTEFKNHLRQAEKGDAYAQAKVAELYLNGVGVKEDVQKGIEWYERASETDEGYAARQLAKIYSEGRYVPKDGEKAAYWRMIGGVLDEL